MALIPFESRVCVASDVLVSEVGGESVFLNLNSERYFGLDEVGTRMWKLLIDNQSIDAAYRAMLVEYDVDEGQLRDDLDELIQQLLRHGLAEVRNE